LHPTAEGAPSGKQNRVVAIMRVIASARRVSWNDFPSLDLSGWDYSGADQFVKDFAARAVLNPTHFLQNAATADRNPAALTCGE